MSARRTFRLLSLSFLRARRRLRWLTWQLYRFHTLTWVAAGSLVGFETLEIMLGLRPSPRSSSRCCCSAWRSPGGRAMRSPRP